MSPQQRESITLYGGDAQRFRDFRVQLAERLGYEDDEVPRPQVVRHLYAHYDGPLD